MGDGAHIKGEAVEHVAAVESLLTVDKGHSHQHVEQAAVDAIVHEHGGARFNVSRTLRERYVKKQTNRHHNEQRYQRAGTGGTAARGAVDGGFAQPYEEEHDAHTEYAHESAQQGDAMEAMGDAPEIADVWNYAFQCFNFCTDLTMPALAPSYRR